MIATKTASVSVTGRTLKSAAMTARGDKGVCAGEAESGSTEVAANSDPSSTAGATDGVSSRTPPVEDKSASKGKKDTDTPNGSECSSSLERRHSRARRLHGGMILRW